MITPHPSWKQIEWLSEDTLLLHFDEPLSADTAGTIAALADQLRSLNADWLWDLTAGFGKLLVHYQPHQVSDDLLMHTLHKAAQSLDAGQRPPASQVTIAVCYDPQVAPDLLDVAQRLQLSVDAVIDLHQSATYRVLAVGFALGFAYLGGLPEQLKLPRKTTPATRVPAGSVAIAETQSTIYPIETPGGWHVIGRTHQPLVSREGALELTLPMGTEVRFEAISYADYQRGIPAR